MRRRLTNWREVWNAYRLGEAIPSLQMREGITIHHRPIDDVWSSLHDVWFSRMYVDFFLPAPTDLVVDLGANIGLLPLHFAASGAHPWMLCCEPDPGAFSSLQKNLTESRLTRVKALPVAAGGTRGRQTMGIACASHSNSLTGSPKDFAHSVPVDVWPLADILNQARELSGGPGISLLKIDIEGSEVELLESASRDSLRQVDRVVLEYHDRLVPRARARCHSQLENAGFRLRERRLQPELGILFAERIGPASLP